MNWNLAKNIFSVVLLAAVFIGIPVAFVNLLGVASSTYSWGLTGQETAAILGFLLYVIGLFAFWKIHSK